MENYKNYEYGIDKEHCKYGLQVSVNSCRRGLFNALCMFEHNQEMLNKKKSDLSNNKTEGQEK